ncbi:MAG: DNA polymerase IV [Provencibacterium sp.]|jgi:DNA polymerase-4|nr:DNA polymerase IV [Provencibacterium sp.]
MDRTILHVDMNAFYASVETLSHPEVRGKPMAVCGDVESRHGIILAKNELAKARGVQTAEPVWQAQRKCPGLILLPPHHRLYHAYSLRANEIYRRYTDRVEPVSIDESYLDVSGSLSLFGSGKEIGDSIRAAVHGELGLTVSVGVSFCKIFAKMGSDYKKPDATTLVSRDNYRELLYPLPVTDLMYVGGATAKILRGLGVRTIGELAALSEQLLYSRLGKHGRTLYRYVQGLDEDPVRREEEQEPVKSIGSGMTFCRDLTSEEEVRTGVLALCETVCGRLRAQGLFCRGVQVTLKNPQLKVTDRQMQLPHPTHLSGELLQAAMTLIRRLWKPGSPIRLITVTAIHLCDAEQGEQLSLFASPKDTEKQEALAQSADAIRRKYGRSALRPAAILKNNLGINS